MHRRLGLAASATARRVVDLISTEVSLTVGAQSGTSCLGIPSATTAAAAPRSGGRAAGVSPSAAATCRPVRAERRVASVGPARPTGTTHAAPADGHENVAVGRNVGVHGVATRTAAPGIEPCAPAAASSDDEHVDRRRRPRRPEVPGAGRREHVVRRPFRIVVPGRNRVEDHLVDLGGSLRPARAGRSSASDEQRRRRRPHHAPRNGASDPTPIRSTCGRTVHGSDRSTHDRAGGDAALVSLADSRGSAFERGTHRPRVAYRGASLGRRFR